MKQGKRPTRAQKIRLKLLKFDPLNWLVVKDFPSGFLVVHRKSGKTRTLGTSNGQ